MAAAEESEYRKAGAPSFGATSTRTGTKAEPRDESTCWWVAHEVACRLMRKVTKSVKKYRKSKNHGSNRPGKPPILPESTGCLRTFLV